jgi:hypothetical protein
MFYFITNILLLFTQNVISQSIEWCYKSSTDVTGNIIGKYETTEQLITLEECLSCCNGVKNINCKWNNNYNYNNCDYIKYSIHGENEPYSFSCIYYDSITNFFDRDIYNLLYKTKNTFGECLNYDKPVAICNDIKTGYIESSTEHWYVLAGSKTSKFTITTCYPETNFDTILEIYHNNHIYLDSNDDSICDDSSHSLLIVYNIGFLHGFDYDLIIKGYGGSSGNYKMSISCDTSSPTLHPTNRPTLHPTNRPTLHPTNRPTLHPTNRPTLHPTNRPTLHPTNRPTLHPMNHPINNQPTNNSQLFTTSELFYILLIIILIIIIFFCFVILLIYKYYNNNVVVQQNQEPPL